MRVRVQSYQRTRYFTVYGIVLILLFATSLWAFSAVQSYPTTYEHWWYFDIPWLLIILVTWFPTVQLISYRKIFLSAELDDIAMTCRLTGIKFAGEWRVKKNYPRRMTSPQAATLVAAFFILVMLIVQIAVLYHLWHTPMLKSPAFSKVVAVQELSLPLILATILVRFGSSWNYPNSIVLLQSGKWLAVQFRDPGAES